MTNAQPGILAPLTRHARYLSFQLVHGSVAPAALDAIVGAFDADRMVIGFGASFVKACEADVAGLHELATHSGPGFTVPATPAALWCWLRADDPGDLVHAARQVEESLDDEFELDSSIDAFVHRGGRDLTGYVDGTENPMGDDAVRVALVDAGDAGLSGSSFVAAQQWLHDFDAFDVHAVPDQDLLIGRRRSDNEEIDDAPDSAHVKRTAQEDFDPPAFLVRRSMPWADDSGAGLVFVAFASSLDPFERQMQRMVGADDGVVDALFEFTRPISSAAFWCPPVDGDARLELSALGR